MGKRRGEHWWPEKRAKSKRVACHSDLAVEFIKLRIFEKTNLVIIRIENHKNDISVRNNLVRYRHTRLDKIPDDHLDEFR